MIDPTSDGPRTVLRPAAVVPHGTSIRTAASPLSATHLTTDRSALGGEVLGALGAEVGNSAGTTHSGEIPHYLDDTSFLPVYQERDLTVTPNLARRPRGGGVFACGR